MVTFALKGDKQMVNNSEREIQNIQNFENSRNKSQAQYDWRGGGS